MEVQLEEIFKNHIGFYTLHIQKGAISWKYPQVEKKNVAFFIYEKFTNSLQCSKTEKKPKN